jgi:hypothetical protein
VLVAASSAIHNQWLAPLTIQRQITEKKTPNSPMKKQHARVKKMLFRLETGFFSSSIRFASEEAVFCW